MFTAPLRETVSNPRSLTESLLWSIVVVSGQEEMSVRIPSTQSMKTDPNIDWATLSNRPTFNWVNPPGAEKSDIWIAHVGGNFQYLRVNGISGTSFTPTQDIGIGTYNFWVRATNGQVQHSYWSVPFQFEVATAPVLAGPPLSTFVTQPVFTWNNMSVPVGGKMAGADSYDFQLYMIDPATFKYVPLPPVSGLTSPTYTIPNALANGQYQAFVRAYVNGRAWTAAVPGANPTYTDYSNAVVFSVGGVPIVNTIPDLTDRTPTISWQAVQGAARYEVYISTATSTTALIRQNGVTGTSYTVAPPLALGAYRVWVRAVSADGTQTSSWSNPVDWTISSTTQPVNPLESASELILAVLPHGIPELSVTSTTVSLADFDDSDSPTAPVSSTEVSGDTPIVLPVPPGMELQRVTAPIAIEESSAEHTDNVLSGWDKQLWWDRSAKDSEAPAVSAHDSVTRTPKSSASFGIPGALLTLVPKAIRRKRDE